MTASLLSHRCYLLPVLLLLFYTSKTIRSQNFDSLDYANDPPDPSPTLEVLKIRTGSRIEIKCSNHNTAAEFVWKFKPCSIESECNGKEKQHAEWRKVGDKWKYSIENGTLQHAGLYRCLVQGLINKEYRLLPPSTMSSYFDFPPPRIVSLQSPSNRTFNNGTLVTSTAGTSLTFNCLSNSSTKPEVRWFQQCYHGNACDVQKNDFCYCRARYSNGSNFAVKNRDGLYLSKLKIENPRHFDAGLYVCLVMTSSGEDYRNITLKIDEYPGMPNGGADDDENRRSFPLLFLIPLGFLLIPVIVWLCYYKRKEASRRAEHKQQELFKPMMAAVVV